jgi:hypothetical protein
MRLQTVAVPDAGHRHVTDSKAVRQSPAAPMSGVLRLSMQSRFHDRLDLIVLGALRTGLAGRFVFQTSHSAFQEMVAPQKDGRSAGLELLSDTPIGQALMGQQANARPQHNFLRSRRGQNPVLQLILLFLSQWE